MEDGMKVTSARYTTQNPGLPVKIISDKILRVKLDGHC
jgi:hypothetical protein